VQLSIGKLATISIALLIAVTVVTTAMGLYVLQANYSTLENRQLAEARDTVRNAAIGLRNQVRFYQGILQLMAVDPEVGDLLEFPDTTEMTRWSHAVGRLLPGTLGTALASPDGVVFGDPLALRVGAACEADIRHFAAGTPIDYPLLHTDISGFEHFDLLARVATPSGGDAGTLFVSFRLSILQELLHGMLRDGDRFLLLDRSGRQKLATPAGPESGQIGTYRTKVPDTSWELVLQRPVPVSNAFLTELIVADAAILTAVAVLMVFLVRGTLWRFKSDMTRVHTALEDVLKYRYEPSDAPTAIKEFGSLLPNIERLALKIQRQRNELRHQSLSDPLTGTFNRRYFDLMLAHLHEQSHRQASAVLVVIDLNDFKRINDEYGHPTGDHVLRETAAYLRSRVRATDIVTRLGGDEFALILTHMAPGMLEEWLTALIHDYDHRALEANDKVVPICQFSIGVARVDAATYATAADVFDAADSAMYAVKQRRRIGHSRFAIARPGNVTAITASRDAL